MPKFQIPAQFIPGFKVLKSITSDQLKQVTEAIKNIKIGTSPDEFSSILKSFITISGIDDLAFTIYNLGSFLCIQDISIELLVKDLIHSYQTLEDPGISKTNLKRLTTNLKEILDNADNLRFSFKALNLLNDSEKVYLESKVISDIRLIFKDKVSDDDRNALIIHQLKIEFQEDNSIKQVYYALNSKDLLKLKSDLDRAIEKEKTIKQNYSKDFTFIELE